MEEIFSLLPEEIQSKLVASADISTALEELLQNLNMKISTETFMEHDENPFISGRDTFFASSTAHQTLNSTPNFENSPSSLKRKLSRAETIISHLELNLEELKNQNSVLEKKILDSIAKEGVLNSKLQKEKSKF